MPEQLQPKQRTNEYSVKSKDSKPQFSIALPITNPLPFMVYQLIIIDTQPSLYHCIYLFGIYLYRQILSIKKASMAAGFERVGN
ncbi:hypothetical protein VST7929_02349 [Vibrio stylophorae]|uniref:Uncharacterized protein n=1 Tax=Vibrio stylophorae TaxID=659351 RepID=A0ABM8ZVP7_9VIBR|nr:hypothetical protein [Vibrio stylophorae]CAH0534417.1 hypothetical protein VST7929_02349 [Vibrio stylophorae]